MQFRKYFTNERFLIGFLAVNIYFIWLIIYFPYFQNRVLWVSQITIEVFLIYLTILFSYYHLVPKYLYKQRYLLFVLGIFLCLAVQIVVMTISFYLISFNSFEFWKGFTNRWLERAFATRLLWVIVSIAIKVYIDQLRLSKQLSEALSKKTQSDMDFLKAQIAPHFLFNSLNAIFFQIDKQNKKARHTLMTFSELLRYQLYESQNDRVLLAKEIDYLIKYFDFHRIRIGEKQIKIELECPDTIPNIEVHPLLFTPMVENAFKFISQYDDRENFVHVTFEFPPNGIVYRVKNSTAMYGQKSPTTGIGLVNLKKRLELVYPSKHTLSTTYADGVFYAELTFSVVHGATIIQQSKAV